jgi:hypothetical protein
MEDRDRDKMNQDESSSTGKKNDIGRPEDWDSEPSRKGGGSSSDSSGWKGDSGRSSGESSSNLGEQTDRSSTRSRSDVEH